MKSVKKFGIFLGSFVLFLALMSGVGSTDVKAAAPKLNKTEGNDLCRSHRKTESKPCKGKSKMDFFPEEDCDCFFQRSCKGKASRKDNHHSNGRKQKTDL